MFQRLLICTDLTDGLQRFADFVPSLAAAGVQAITFLHVIPLSQDQAIPKVSAEKQQQARDRLGSAMAQGHPDVAVQIEVQVGKPVDRILSVAQGGQFDLIVLGAPARSLLTEKLFGSTTINLCQRCVAPLMIFRPQFLSVLTNEEFELRCRHLFRELLIPYDASKTADALVERLQRAAQHQIPGSPAMLNLLWVLEEANRRETYKTDRTSEAMAKLDQVKASLNSLNLTATAEVRQGNPVLQTMMVAQEKDISAIVLSSASPGKLLELSIPSFSGEVMRRSGFPVLFFPTVKS